MLNFAAITPHPPIAIPQIGGDELQKINKTIQALQKLETLVYNSKIETLLVISPHAQTMENIFTLNTAPQFNINFKNFGDLETKLSFNGDIGLAHRIKEYFEEKNLVKLVSNPELDHGTAIPLYYLLNNLPQVKILSLAYSGLSLEKHYQFGQELTELFHSLDQKIGIIASGDLSHSLNKNSPAGYSPAGEKLDKTIINSIKNKQPQKILNLQAETISAAQECGLKSIIILLGILKNYKYEPQILSYEAPFGVGYLTTNFFLNQ